MIKQYLVLLGFVFIILIPTQIVKSETNPEAEDMYVTAEDIILDIIFPTIDKRVIKEYGGENLFDWQWKRIIGITYNDNHSYDVIVRIEIPPKNLNDDVKEDLVKVRISPSCDSEKINKQKCNHQFEIKILDYKHLSS
ncbi:MULTISPECIES: hypothetical protein [Ureibacillus]|uniref:DUF3888 domain-containing protein n=2 Tax=Ureibacillus TaxID=160795 RepID=A0A0A3J109_9BACL|nr:MULTISPECIES: hypothetical protein [Ureibacillus]KGR89385.1 hypothetical protein CD30_17125 [Ureibacillus massiliensis 4400831 = CIP 108448 = CCUG 49529]MCM3390405.1 hypothetical protein [Ureibacillus chungkukjangi]PYF08576.1 hypothetical protein BJ095_102343 [Ureibacillus chungkukjangi]